VGLPSSGLNTRRRDCKGPELVQEVKTINLGSPPRMAWALEPHSLRVAGLSTILELPMVRNSRLVWVCLFANVFSFSLFYISLLGPQLLSRNV